MIFANECHKNKGLANAALVTTCANSVDGKYVVVDQSLTAEQVTSISAAVKSFDYPIKEIFFSNNLISGKSFAKFLGWFSEE